MKKLEDLGLRIPEILLPKNIDLSTWSVIACDQYTQDKDYWKNVEEKAGNKPSTLNLILPEVYLGSPDKADRIKKIRQSMKEYLDTGVFADAKKCFIYLERKTAFGRTRKGLVAQIDLETYEWKPFSKANIRATEATIVERIPPRMEIRKGAPLELPHIMLLVNDKDDLLVGANKPTDGRAPIYDGDLMANGGHITGWALESKVDIEGVEKALNLIAEKNASPDGSTFLFAVGDGNHSLATAKAVWDEYKKEHPEDKDSPVRYALIEIVNIYDTGLTFEPIHRVIFNIDNEALIKKLAEKLNGNIKALDDADKVIKAVKDSWANFGFFYLDSEGKQKNVLLETKIKELAVARLQPEIDAFLKELQDQSKAEIDYIHGTDEVLKLGSKENSLGILLPPIAKDSFFETINGRGPLPRKSFSMGEADEKRFYLECRRLFS
ncbi:MAG: DUF1015 domain-containing protein [Treponema sp.]|nr:DUF1015 domain-containing protein [Treponema sp.]MCI7566205.1 DUF1015 domain-containing protein [Treponema sp.]